MAILKGEIFISNIRIRFFHAQKNTNNVRFNSFFFYIITLMK